MADHAQPGYNIIESQYLRNYIIPEDTMGFIQFMRNIHRKRLNKKAEYLVTGLDRILYESETPKEVAKTIREELVEARKWIPRGLVVIFPIEGELRGREDYPILHLSDVDIDLRQLFGNRIERKSVARCFASFDIEK